MSKRYVLLKDLLYINSGNILRVFANHYLEKINNIYYKFEGLEEVIKFDIVENNPDWFKEITDTPPNPTKNVIVGGVEYISPRDVWEREKKAFEAARCKLNFYSLSPFPGDKYPTFEDYKKDNL